MTLYHGTLPIKAPCIECSSDRRLEDLERELAERNQIALEREQIKTHNALMAGL